MTAPEQAAKRYHLKNIRTLLAEGFADEELRQFCLDDPAFRPFYPHLPQPASRAELARLIVVYACKKSLLYPLLIWAKEQNPARYEIHQPYEIPLTGPAAGHEECLDLELEPLLPAPEQILAHRAALAQKAEYRRWGDEFYIREESKILPLLASPYDDDSGQQREDLLQTIRAHERLLVLGEPGMGKTVALERMMWETTQADEPIVPIFVPLLFFQGSLIEAVRVALSETGQLHFDELKTVRTFLRQTRCLIMFDGLNEVPGQQREKVVGAIADFLREFSHHRYLVTSRSQDELWKKLRATEVIKEAVVIQRITDEQVRGYLMAHLGESKGKDLHDRLNECLRGLSRTPLLLWMVKEAGLEGKELPGNRGELFDLFVNKMLTRDEKLKLMFPWWAKRRVLAYLALNLQEAHQLAYERERAVEIIAESKINYEAEAILNEMLLHGLLQGKQQIRFLHQSVQEYFVARALLEVARAERQAPTWQRVSQRLLRRNLAAWARDAWWEECFVQLAGLIEDSLWLVCELVPVNPWLAFWCSIEGKPIEKETQSVIEAQTITLLRSKDAKQRLQAVKELARFENPRTIKYLVKVLDDEDDKVTNTIVEILSKFGEPAVEPLLAALHGRQRAGWAATQALGQIWQLPDLKKLGDNKMDIQQSAAIALGKLGDKRTVTSLIVALKFGDENVRSAAAEALGKLGDVQAVEPLIAALKYRGENVRRAATQALGRIWQLSYLIKLGSNNNWERGLAAGALGKLGDVRVVEPLIAALKDSDKDVRRAATGALGKLGDVRAVEPLLTVLKDNDDYVRGSSVWALGKLGDARTVEPLIDVVLKDNNSIVRWAGVEALGQLEVQLETIELRERVVESLIVALEDIDWHVRQSAAEALGKLGDIRAVDPLIFALKDSIWDVRQSANVALHRIGTSEALAAVRGYEARNR